MTTHQILSTARTERNARILLFLAEDDSHGSFPNFGFYFSCFSSDRSTDHYTPDWTFPRSSLGFFSGGSSSKGSWFLEVTSRVYQPLHSSTTDRIESTPRSCPSVSHILPWCDPGLMVKAMFITVRPWWGGAFLWCLQQLGAQGFL